MRIFDVAAVARRQSRRSSCFIPTLWRARGGWHAQSGVERKDGRGGLKCWVLFFQHRQRLVHLKMDVLFSCMADESSSILHSPRPLRSAPSFVGAISGLVHYSTSLRAGRATRSWLHTIQQGKCSIDAIREEIGHADGLIQLLVMARDGKLRERNRALAVLASLKGISCRSATRFLRINTTTILRYQSGMSVRANLNRQSGCAGKVRCSCSR